MGQGTVGHWRVLWGHVGPTTGSEMVWSWVSLKKGEHAFWQWMVIKKRIMNFHMVTWSSFLCLLDPIPHPSPPCSLSQRLTYICDYIGFPSPLSLVSFPNGSPGKRWKGKRGVSQARDLLSPVPLFRAILDWFVPWWKSQIFSIWPSRPKIQ